MKKNIEIKIKPLSVNKVWRGQRFKTQEYKDYERDWFYLLPKLDIPKGKISLAIIWGMSNKVSDIDNPAKPLIDILQKKYNFNDKSIYELFMKKVDVKKGCEYISFSIEKL